MKIKYILIILIGVFFSGCVGFSSTGLFGTGISIEYDPRYVGTQIDN